MENIIEKFKELNIDLKGKTSGKIRTTCHECSANRTKKSDPCLFVDIDNSYYYCHHCGATKNFRDKPIHNTVHYEVPHFVPRTLSLNEKVIAWFKTRGISEPTLNRMQIQAQQVFIPQVGRERNAVVFPYFYLGECINKKFRDGDKNFVLVSKAYKTFYNIDAIYDSPYALIQEGEIDVLSSIECGIYFAVSVPNGATKGNINLSYLDDVFDSHFKDKERIYLGGDTDDAGKNLHEKLAARLGKHRCFVVDWEDCKDGNEYLCKHGKENYINAINNAQPYPLSGVLLLNKDVEAKLLHNWEHGAMKGETTHIKSLDPHFTWLKKDVIVWAGYNNLGKTELLLYMLLLKSVHSGWRHVVAGFEDKTPDRFYNKLIEMYVGKRIDPSQQRYLNQMTKDELRRGIEFVREHFIFIRPEGGFQVQKTMDLISTSLSRYGGDTIVIDPINKLVKAQTHLRDDEYLIQYYAEQEQFAVQHNVASIHVTHVGKPILNGDMPSKPSRFQLLGGQATGNAVDEILMVHYGGEQTKDPERLIIVDKVRDRDLVGIPGEITVKFDFKKRRFMDKGEDPIIGYGVNRLTTMPIQQKFDDGIRYVEMQNKYAEPNF